MALAEQNFISIKRGRRSCPGLINNQVLEGQAWRRHLRGFETRHRPQRRQRRTNMQI